MPRKIANKSKIGKEKPIEDLKKLFSDRFASGVTKANATLITWIIALILIVVTAIFPLSSQLQKVKEERAKIIEKKLRKDKQNREASDKEDGFTETASTSSNSASNSDKANASNSNSGKSNSNTGANAVGKTSAANKPDAKAVENEVLDEQELQFAGKSASFKELKNELTEIPLPFGKLPGIKKIYAPVVWSVLFAGFLAFFLFSRIKLFSTLARIIDINRRECGKTPKEIEGLGSGVPFWLAPLPKWVKTTNGKTIDSHDFKCFLGWKIDLERNTRFTLMTLGAGFLIFLWVIYVVMDSLTALSDPQDGLRLLISVIGLFVLSLIACFYWLKPKIRLKNFSTRLREESANRRNFIKVAGTALGIGAIYVLTPRKILPRSMALGKPRFRKKLRPEFGKEHHGKFLIYKDQVNVGINALKTNFVYYVGLNGLSSGVYKILKSKNKNIPNVLKPEHIAEVSRSEIINLKVKPLSDFPAVDEKPANPKGGQNKPSEKDLSKQSLKPQNAPVSKVLTDDRFALRADEGNGSKIEPNPPKAIEAIAKSDNQQQPVAPQAPPSDRKNVSKKPKQLPPVRINPQQFSAIIECLALEQLNSGNVDAAFDLLMSAIKVNRPGKKPDYRLFDLYAGLTYKYSRIDRRTKLIEFIDKNMNTDRGLKIRKARWINPTDRWKAKWSSVPLKWKTPFKERSAYFGFIKKNPLFWALKEEPPILFCKKIV